MRVLVDQAVHDGFSADLLCVDFGHGGAGSVTFVVRDALGDATIMKTDYRSTVCGTGEQSPD